MKEQIKTKSAKVSDIIAKGIFQLGYADAKEGLSLYDRPWEFFRGDTNDEWNYERGRQFSYLFNRPLKRSGQICKKAVHRLKVAIGRKEIT